MVNLGAGETFGAHFDFNGDGLVSYEVVNPVSKKVTERPGGSHSSHSQANIYVSVSADQRATAAPRTKGRCRRDRRGQIRAPMLDHIVNLGGQYFDSKTDSHGNPVDQGSNLQG